MAGTYKLQVGILNIGLEDITWICFPSHIIL